MKVKTLLNNQEGSVLILALIILVLLTIMGMSMTTTSSIEVQIAANNKTYKENLYNAEGAAMYAAQMIENETDKNKLIPVPGGTHEPWLLDALADSEVSNSSNWGNGDSVPGITDNSFIAVHEGFARGSSMDMTTQSQLHEFSVYGRSLRDQGLSIVALGFRKRF